MGVVLNKIRRRLGEKFEEKKGLFEKLWRSGAASAAITPLSGELS